MTKAPESPKPDRTYARSVAHERGEPSMSDTATTAPDDVHEDGSLERLTIDTIRTLSMDAVQAANSGHPGTPLALAPVGYELWAKFLRPDPAKPDWPNRDRFVLSVGHASRLLYSLLHLAGVREIDRDGKPTGNEAVSLHDIEQFRQLGSKTPGHPEYRHTTGVETTTGPLGQGCGNSVGMAIAERWLAARYNRDGFDLFDHDVYALCGDGDMMEGVSAEAASIAGHLKLSNLCWIYDSNHISIEGDTALAFDEDVGKRFQAYGWHVIHVDDANDLHALSDAFAAFRKTDDMGAPSFEPGNYGGANFHFGVREHGMGAVVNGMTLSHLRGYGSTFLVFADYMRAPIRLSAIMELPATWVFTHDSIGVGEDGPTHQPIEHLATLRAIPGLDTIRPCDANEVAAAWKASVAANTHPTALILSRQALPTRDRSKYAAADGLARGAYVLADSDKPQVILIATGSEVLLAVEAYEQLKGEGIAARVVSMPSWFRYEQQSAADMESVLPRGVTARLAIEGGGEIGWDRYVGLSGRTITMSTFGASAPLAKLQDKFGFTVDNVVKQAKAMLETK